MDHYLSPAEAAKRFGTTIKALRLYEQRGLLTPLRASRGSTGSGWRTYGPDQITRLHQILALKRLGLPLARIGELLGSANALGPVLALQEHSLVRDGERLAHALKVVRAARAKLVSGEVLSIDDLATLAKETVMTSKPNLDEIKAIFQPLIAKHLTPEELEEMRQRKQKTTDNVQIIQSEYKLLMDSGADPTSPPAQSLARRLRDALNIVTGGDPEMLKKLRAVRDEARTNPVSADRLPPKDPVLDDFVRRAREHLETTS